MSENMKLLPVDKDLFDKVRQENFYYVDKTSFIEDFLNDQA